VQRQRSPGREIRGLRFEFYAILCVIVAIALLAIPAGVPLRNPTTGSLIGASPFKDSLIVLILVTGLAHGRGATTFTALPQGMAAITKTFSGVGRPHLFLFPVISLFLAHFNYSTLRRSPRSIWLTQSSS